MSKEILHEVQSRYAAVAAAGLCRRPSRRSGRGRGVRLHAGGAGLHPRRGQHGPVVRQPDGLRRPAAGRDGRGPRLRRRPGRAAGGGEGRPDRQGRRHRHDAGNDRPGAAERGRGRAWATPSFTSPPSTGCRWPTAPRTASSATASSTWRRTSRPSSGRCYRVLKPGGRAAVSDIALKKPLPDELARDVMAYVGCIAGAVFRSTTIAASWRRPASSRPGDRRGGGPQRLRPGREPGRLLLPAMTSPTGLPMTALSFPGGRRHAVHAALADLLRKYDVNEYAASVRVYALKGR